MADRSPIEWTDATWNFVDGCEKVSPGCAQCYAEAWAHRGLGHFAGGRPFEEVRVHEAALPLPLHWTRPRRVFVVSMGDPFHEAVPRAILDRAHAVMALADHHIYQVLTKRADRLRDYYGAPDLRARLAYRLGEFVHAGLVTFEQGAQVAQGLTDGSRWPLRQVWLGFSAENQRWFDARWQACAALAAAGWLVWVSIEPMLEHMNISAALPTSGAGLRWVVAGGESGRGARPFDVDWARSLRAPVPHGPRAVLPQAARVQAHAGGTHRGRPPRSQGRRSRGVAGGPPGRAHLPREREAMTRIDYREHLHRRLQESGVPGGTGLIEYIAARRPTGQFLRAVLSNDLKEAVARADPVSRLRLYELVVFLYNYAPGSCWGSPERVEAWLHPTDDPPPMVFE